MCVKNKWKAIFPPTNFKKIKKGGDSFLIMVEEPLTFNNIYFLEVNWCYSYFSVTASSRAYSHMSWNEHSSRLPLRDKATPTYN